MQPDENFVIYNRASQPIWSSNTYNAGPTPGVHAVMQSDGNVVVYRGAGGDGWSSGTSARGTVCHLQMQDDANLVAMCDGHAVWSSIFGIAP